jgi:hypothetical protein
MSRLLPILSPAERAVAVQEARRLLTAGKGHRKGKPVPWRHQGRTLRGLDCLGVPAWVLGRLGCVPEDATDYSPHPDGERLQATLRHHFGEPIWKLGDRYPKWKWRAGDIVLMRWHERLQNGLKLVLPNHVGVLTDTPYEGGGLAVLHSYAAQKEVTEHRLAAPWDRRILEVYSLTGGDW